MAYLSGSRPAWKGNGEFLCHNPDERVDPSGSRPAWDGNGEFQCHDPDGMAHLSGSRPAGDGNGEFLCHAPDERAYLSGSRPAWKGRGRLGDEVRQGGCPCRHGRGGECGKCRGKLLHLWEKSTEKYGK